MPRRTRLTVLELGASSTAWVACHGLGADDWVVVAQQSDEAAAEFTERVSQRARRLRREDAQIDVVDVYTSPHSGPPVSSARRVAVEALGGQMAQGGRLTLWSDANDDSEGDTELAAILVQLGPVLAERQIAMNHQTCDPDEQSGTRHSLPPAPRTGFDSLADFDDLA